MTKYLKSAMSCLTALIIASSTGSPVNAAQLLFSPDADNGNSGSIDTALPLDKIASVTLPRGTVIIHGDTVQVNMVPEWQFDRRAVLNGRVLDTRRISTTAPTTVSGVFFFTGGEWIDYFDNKEAIETIVTDKETLSGRINNVSNLDIELVKLDGKTVAVPLSAVQEIRSPRAFSFDIPLQGISPSVNFNQPLELSANSIHLAQLGRTFRLAQLRTIARRQSNDGDISTPKLVALGTTVSLLNLAQLAPLLGISLGAEPTMRRRAFFKNFVFNAPEVFGK